MSENNNKPKKKPKWKHLVYRQMSIAKESCEFMRCQVGKTVLEHRFGPSRAAEPVFVLLGYGPTMEAAEKMAEKRFIQ